MKTEASLEDFFSTALISLDLLNLFKLQGNGQSSATLNLVDNIN